MKSRREAAQAKRKQNDVKQRRHAPSPSWRDPRSWPMSACCMVLAPIILCSTAYLCAQLPHGLQLSHLGLGRAKTPSSTLAACRSEREDFDALVQQLSAAGANLEAVDLGYTGSNRGLVATRDIPQGATVLSVPLELSLSIATFSGRMHAAAATQAWWEAQAEDTDMFLDPLALLTELLVRGSASPWALYLCTLPPNYDSFGLPISYQDAWSLRLMRQLPELWRLVRKRSALVTRFKQLVGAALRKMPGAGSSPGLSLLNDPPALARLSLWSYAAAKTRTVALDLQQAEEAGARLLLRRSSGGGGSAAAAAASEQLLVEPVLPAGLRRYLDDMGVMVPVFDMANHAPAATASAVMAVRFRQRSEDGVGAGAAAAGHVGVGVSFSLVAARNISAGDEITFSYNPDDDDAPACNERWLLEYGFIMEDGKPERCCHAWNVTTLQVASALSPGLGGSHGAGEEGSEPGSSEAEEEAAVARRLRAAGQPAWTVARLDGTGTVHASLVGWVSAAVGPAREGFEGVDGVEVQEAWALGVLCGLVQRQHAALEPAVAAAAEQLEGEAAEEEPGEAAERRRRRAALLAVARGAVQAAQATARQLRAFCRPP